MISRIKGFNLPELAIILAILALLAAIAVPNFYEAKTSSMIAQAKEDMRTISVGLEAYKADTNGYPSMHTEYSCLVPPSLLNTSGFKPTLERLTTPVSYLSGALPFYDPFEPTHGYVGFGFSQKYTPNNEEEEATLKQYLYMARNTERNTFWDDDSTSSPTWYLLESSGPDLAHNFIGLVMNFTYPNHQFSDFFYDATNGTISHGSLWRIGGKPEGRGVVMRDLYAASISSRVSNWQEMER